MHITWGFCLYFTLTINFLLLSEVGHSQEVLKENPYEDKKTQEVEALLTNYQKVKEERIESNKTARNFIEKLKIEKNKNDRITVGEIIHQLETNLDRTEGLKFIQWYLEANNQFPNNDKIYYTYISDPTEKLQLYSGHNIRLINILNLLIFCWEHSLNFQETNKSKVSFFSNKGLSIENASFSSYSDSLSLNDFEKLFISSDNSLNANISFLENAKKLKEKIETGKSIKELEETLMIPAELFDKKIKILFVFNICTYFKDGIDFEDVKRTVSFEDYAFYHLKSMTKYFHQDSEITLSHIHGFKFGYSNLPFTQKSLEEFLAPIDNTNRFDSELKYSSLFQQATLDKLSDSEESITPLYQKLTIDRNSYDYVFYFTDGYPFEIKNYGLTADTNTIQGASDTVFLLKGMSMAKHPEIFHGYANQVTDPKKDKILNDKYYFPRYDEYFDKKEALMKLDKFIEMLEKN